MVKNQLKKKVKPTINLRQFINCLVCSFLFLVFSLHVTAQEKQVYQVKTLDSQLKPHINIKISINGNDYIAMGEKGVAFVELSSNDLPIKSVEINDDKLEAASWNLSKGILEIIIRKKSYRIVKLSVQNSEGVELNNIPVTFKGKKILTASTNAEGQIEFPLALNENVNSAEQFIIDGYVVKDVKINGNENILIADLFVATEVPMVQDVSRDNSPAFDVSALDTVQSLVSFYDIIKNYQIEEMNEGTKSKIDAKFNELMRQLQDSGIENTFSLSNIISDSTNVQNDVKNLLEQARLENQMLQGQQSNIEEKIEVVNEKLKVGFENLDEPARASLLEDLNMLEALLAENESKFNNNQDSYRQMVTNLKERFFNLEDLENKLSASEAQRLEEQQIFRQRFFLILFVVAVFGVLIILLIYLSSKLEKQKKKLEVANAEVQRINENLEGIVYERTKLLKETNKELDTVLYRASHDLRSPVRSIIGLCNIAKTFSNGDNKELFERMVQTTEDMDKLLKKLTVISEINQPVTFSVVNLARVIKDIENKFKHIIRDFKIKFIVDCPQDLVVYSNPNLIEVILINLIENALFYCIIKNSKDYKVAFTAAVHDDHLEFSIFDNGVGVDCTVSDRLFEMFYRGNEFSKGNGLGLYIVQKSVLALKGKITVDSEPGQFSRFVVQLPLQEMQEHPLQISESAESFSDDISKKGKDNKLVDAV